MPSAAQQCFDNEILISEILDHFSYNPMEDLELRLLTRAFNSEIVRRIRKTHQRVDIESFDSHYYHTKQTQAIMNLVNLPPLQKFPTKIVINGLVMDASDALGYFRFLSKVANVKIEELNGRNLWMLSDKMRSTLHRGIHEELLRKQTLNVFTGMEDICQDGCLDCLKQALQCSEYGAQLGILNSESIKKPHCFKKLIISETLILGVAAKIMNSSTSRKNCYQHMSTYINTNVRCDHLCLVMAETSSHEETFLDQIQMLPCELVYQMCQDWNVKSIGIQYDYIAKKYPSSEEAWDLPDFFTMYRIFDICEDLGVVPTPTVKFDYVEVDLRRSILLAPKVVYEQSIIIENIRKLFPAEKMFVHGNEMIRDCYPLVSEKSLQNVFELVRKVDAGNSKEQNGLEVTISIFSPVAYSIGRDAPEYLNYLARKIKCTVLPGVLSYVSSEWKPSEFDWIGKRIRITDDSLVINLDVFIERNDLRAVVEEAHEICFRGFIKRFV